MGSPAVVTSAVVTCPMGAAPATLTVLPTSRVLVEGRPVATVRDMIPLLNVATFGMCMSPANPTVAAATAAALGVLVPMPCVPVLSAPWLPGSAKTLVGGAPATLQSSTCQCAYGGVVQVVVPGATKTMIG